MHSKILQYHEVNRHTTGIKSGVRSRHVDIIKGWAMLTIILFHCSTNFFPGKTGQFMGQSWNVPVFFIIGGFFLRCESLDTPIAFLKGKFKRLYIPVTFIYGLNVLLHNVFVSIGWYPLGGVHPANGRPFILYGPKQTLTGLLKVLAAGGSGELTMGAMWFLYALLYAFVGIVIIYSLISWVCKKNEKRFYWVTAALLLCAVASCVLTQKCNFTICRFSTAATAMFLIWWGMIINKKWQWSFDKWWGFAVALIVFVHSVLMMKGRLVMALNQYQDLIHLIVGSTSAIYLWGFIGKKIETTFIGRFLALMGRESLYLMSFHIIGLFICNSLMVKLGVFSQVDKIGLYTYNLGNNGWLLLIYVFFGVAASFALLYAYRGVKWFAIRFFNKLSQD